MKNVLLIAIALITVNVTAQKQKRERQHEDRKERLNQLKDFSPEEIATLQSKKMALHLDLSNSQQKEIKAISLENAKARKIQMEAHEKKRKEGKREKLTKEDRFNRANNQLDRKLATKAKMKTILNKEQYEKWEHGNATKGKHKAQKQKKRSHDKMTEQRRKRN